MLRNNPEVRSSHLDPIGYPETSVRNYHYLLRNNPEVRTSHLDPIGCPETSVRNYHYLLRNNPEVRSSHLDPIGYPETSVRNYHYLLRNNPAVRSSHLTGGGSLKTLTSVCVLPAPSNTPSLPSLLTAVAVQSCQCVALTHDMNAGNLQSFLTLLVVVSFTIKSLYTREQIIGTCRRAGCVGPRALLGAVAKRKIIFPYQESKPDSYSTNPYPDRSDIREVTAKLSTKPEQRPVS